MHHSVNNFNLINKEINQISSNVKIIAVSKTFEMKDIEPLIQNGHTDFGENKVQEAVDKWTSVKNSSKNLKLHMIGKLQSNKVKYVIPLFDYIHSLDNWKLAEKISKEQSKIKKSLKIFIQVNIGNEEQKSGIDPKELSAFYDKCISVLNLNIIGLMCIPPQDGNVQSYFNQMHELNNSLNLKELSMGMSADYLQAVNHGSTFVRIGSKIFGSRI